MSELAVGLMSGTSLDGVDAALVRFTGERPRAELIAFHTRPYDAAFRRAVLTTIEQGTARDLARLHVELGRTFAEATTVLLQQAGVLPSALAFVASHGQTVWHEPGAATLQLGDPSVIAEQLGVKVVSDFRSRDVAAGGQGAPLVPIADALLFAASHHDRLLLNIGGIANVTRVPAGGALDGLLAFDTGPGVAVIDGVVRLLRPDLPFDRDGRLGLQGRPVPAVLEELLAEPYFAAPPPKSTGRERFGEALARTLAEAVRRNQADASDEDCIATAVALTADSIADQVRRWLPSAGTEIVVSGGGARNVALRERLGHALSGYTLVPFENLFFDGDAKEAVAFALLGWLTLRGRPGNVPAATGAKGFRVLGSVVPG